MLRWPVPTELASRAQRGNAKREATLKILLEALQDLGQEDSGLGKGMYYLCIHPDLYMADAFSFWEHLYASHRQVRDMPIGSLVRRTGIEENTESKLQNPRPS
jgi:hypothetical protein